MKKTTCRILASLIIFFSIIGAQSRCLNKVEEIVKKDTIAKYNETIIRQSSEIERSFAEIYKSLNSISYEINDSLSNEQDYFNIAEIIEDKTLTTKANKAFFLDLDGIMYTSDEKKEDYHNTNLYLKSLNKEEFLSEPFNEIGNTQNRVVAFLEPVERNGKHLGSIGLIFTTYQLNNFTGQVSNEENGYLYLLNESGHIISSPVDDQNHSIFSYIQDDDVQSTETVNKIINSEGTISDVFEKSGDLVVSTRMDDSYSGYGIFAVKIIPAATIEQYELEAVSHIFKMIAITTTLVILLLGLFLYIIFSKNKADKKFLKELAYLDLVTNGNNFQYFNTILEDEKYKDGYIVALDIRSFKEFQRLYHNFTTSKVLADVYKIIEKSISEDCVLAHEESDQFGLYVPYTSEEKLEELLNHINDNLRKYSEEKSYPDLTFYYGIRLFNHNENPSDLYNEAKNALRENKHDKSTIFFYHKGLGKSEEERNNLIISRFKDFINNKSFFVEYQPKFDVLTGKVIGAEAFVRLKLNNGQTMYPDDFIKPLEDAGVIAELDNYVFTTIVDLLSNLSKQGKPLVPISMNVSRLSLYRNSIAKQWSAYLADNNVRTDMIALEIKDEHLNSEAKLIEILNDFKNKGFKFHVDRFGGESSTLLSISSINFDVVKLDKSLIDKIGDFKSEIVLRHVASLANDLGIKVIAFGVENSKQANFIKEIGVTSIQGPYYSSPLCVEDFIEILTHYLDINLNDDKSFEMLTRTVMLSTFASPKLSDKDISAMTGAILELGLKNDEVYLMGCNINAVELFKINLDNVAKSKDYICVKGLTYDDDYISLKETINKTIKTKEPHTVDVVFKRNDYTICVECRLFYKTVIFGYKEVYLFARKKEITTSSDLVNQLPGGLLIYRPNDNQYITLVNNELLKITECKDLDEFKEFYDNKLNNLIYEQDYRVVMNSMFVQFFASDEKKARVKFRIKKKSGKIIYVSVHAYYQLNNIYGDLVYCYIESLERQNEAELQVENSIARLQYESTHDGLTGLVNQASIKSLVTEVFEKNPNTEFALMVMDIDDFKQVNDNHGHSFGDTVIKTFANILSNCVSRPGLCARIGGDEFVVLEPITKENLEQIAERFYNTLHFTLGECVISPSIGVTSTIISYRKYADLFLDADKALYTSKNVGKDTYTIYEETSIETGYRKDESRKDTFNTAQIIQTVDKLASLSDALYCVLDLRANKMHTTDNVVKEFNIPSNDIDAQEFFENTVFESDIEMLKEEINKLKKGIKEEHDMVYRWLDKDNNPVWIKAKGKVIKNHLKPWCLVCTINVITK